MIDMLHKIIKALNSSEYSWQLSLAIALGMIAGLSPAFNLHNILIYLLAFIINIHLGLFFISVTIFAAISYLADPLMEALGYYLLTLSDLESFWTTIYNSPLLALLNLNNSLVLGSLVIGLVLFLPLFFMMQRVVKIYRGPISNITSKIPLIRSILSFDKTAAEATKKPKKLRLWGIGVLLALTVPIAIFGIFFMDNIIKSQLESALSNSAGRVANVGSVKTTLFPLSITITSIVIPDRNDEMKNSAEIAKVAFDLDLARALHKKAIINEMSINGIKLETTRTKPSKKLAATPAPKPSSDEAGIGSKLALEIKDHLPSPSDLVKNEKLKSDIEGKQIEARLSEIKNYWEGQKQKFDPKIFTDLQDRYKDLEKRAKKIKNEKDLKAVLKDAKAFEKDLNTRQKEYRDLIKQFNSDSKESKELLARLKELPNEDYKALKDKYSLDSSGAFNVAEALLGSNITGYIKMAQRYYNDYSPYLAMLQETRATMKGEPLPKPERGKGRVVKFVEYHPTPKFLIKKAGMDLTTKNGDLIVGLLTNVSSSQKTIKKPMEFAAKSAKSVGYKSLELFWRHDRFNENVDLITLNLLGAERPKIESNRVFMDRSKLDTAIDLIIKDGKLLGDGRLNFTDTKLGIDKPKGEMEKIVDRTLGSVDSFVVEVKAKGKPFAPAISLKTDLDSRLKKAFQSELAKAQKEFEVKLKQEIAKKSKAYLEKAVASAKDIESLEKLINKETNAMDILNEKTGKNLSQKALENELKDNAKKELDEKKDELSKKAKDGVKNLFKNVF